MSRAVLLLTFLFAACGQSGDLYLPAEPAPPAEATPPAETAPPAAPEEPAAAQGRKKD